jgi:hypothetical protein
MAVVAVSITKSVSFRGVQQEFSNVYHYSGTTPTVAQADLLAAAIKAIEVPFHSTDVTFVRYKVWTAGGSAGANNMISQGTLSGTGNQTTVGGLDRERAVLVRFTLGFDSRGRPKYLRKWYHSCGNFAGAAVASSGTMQNTTAISGTDRTTVQNAADDLLSVTAGGNTYSLCSPSGQLGSTPVLCHAYLEHHQLGDMWR